MSYDVSKGFCFDMNAHEHPVCREVKVSAGEWRGQSIHWIQHFLSIIKFICFLLSSIRQVSFSSRTSPSMLMACLDDLGDSTVEFLIRVELTAFSAPFPQG